MDFNFSNFESMSSDPSSDARLSNDLRRLSNEELHRSLVHAAREEKRALLVLLEHIHEGERRRLYAERIFPSMHEYLRSLGYTDGQVQERIMAARLLHRVPEARTAFQEDKLSLTSMAMLERHSRNEELKPHEAREIVKTCESKSVKEVWKVIASESTESIPKPDQIRAVSRSLTKFVFEADEDFVKQFERAKELLGNPGASVQEIFQKGLDLILKKREIKPVKESKAENSPAEPSFPRQEFRRDASLSITARTHSRRPGGKLMNDLRIRANDRCERMDEKTGTRCACRTGLEADHYPIPYAKGGPTTLENLRLVCRAHNLEFAIHSYGKQMMGKYLRRP